VTGVIDPPPPQGIVREWEWEWEFTRNGKHAMIPRPFVNAIPRMAKGMTTAVLHSPLKQVFFSQMIMIPSTQTRLVPNPTQSDYISFATRYST